VGGHLTALARTQVGNFTIDEAVTLDELAARERPVTLSLAEAADRCLPRRDLTEDEAHVVSHGGPLAPLGRPGPYAAFDPAGDVVAVMIERDGRARPDVVFKPGG
jgi:tRNA pseudouridine55 synthase